MMLWQLLVKCLPLRRTNVYRVYFVTFSILAIFGFNSFCVLLRHIFIYSTHQEADLPHGIRVLE